MIKFAFVSDFDGTFSEKDFYHIIIDKYLGQWGKDFYAEWKSTKKINVEFLNIIFGKLQKNEEELYKEILEIPMDKGAVSFISDVKAHGGDFYILSAGTSYYIKILFKHLNITDVEIISMDGVYENGGIRIIPDKSNPFYSDVFGIDKRKVIQELKKRYDKVYFAGDSEPDISAAKAADVAFGKKSLKKLLQRDNISFVPADSYEQIAQYMKESEWK